jgi:3',5'-cyclic-AMP phosphodiesterase
MPNVLLRFLHISDTHYSSPDYQRPPSRFGPRAGVDALLRHIKALPYTPDFILHTGDVVYDPHPDIYPEARDLFATLTPEIIYIPGNHDHSPTFQQVLLGRETVQPLVYYELERNSVRLLCLDSNGPDGTPPRGHVTDEQLTWLRERLAEDDPRPILVFIHHPLLKTHTSVWYDEFMMTINGDAVHDVLKTAADRIQGVFHGHTHHHITFNRDGIMYSGIKSSWTQFHIWPDQTIETANDLPADPGYALVTVTTAGTFIQHFTYRHDATE